MRVRRPHIPSRTRPHAPSRTRPHASSRGPAGLAAAAACVVGVAGLAAAGAPAVSAAGAPSAVKGRSPAAAALAARSPTRSPTASSPTAPSPAASSPTARSLAARVTLAPAEPEVTAVAAQGGTVAWLSGDARGRGATRPRYLSVRDAGTRTARRLDLRLPKGTDGIDVGTDAAGRPVALLGTGSHTWTVPLAPGAVPAARRIAGSARWGAVAMLRGHVAYTRVGRGRPTVFVARRPGAAGRRTFTFPRPYAPVELALGRGDVVVAHGYRAVDNGAADVLWRAGGGRARKLLTQSTGGASENGMGRPTVTQDGTRVNVSRWNVGGGHPNDLTSFSVRTGRVLSTAEAATDRGAEAVFQLGLDGGESVISAASYSGCSTPSIPVDDAPPCLGLDLLER